MFGRAVETIDRRLRAHKGIYEFSRHPHCILRVAIVPAGESVELSDGTRIAADDRVVDLHFWNERVPPIPASGPGLGWAIRAQRRLEASLIELARHLKAQPDLHDIRAVRGDAAFVTRLEAQRLDELAALFGFEREGEQRAHRQSLGRRLHRLGADLLIWALLWTFNRHALREGFIRPRRDRFWMSREALLRRYGTMAHRGERPAPRAARDRTGVQATAAR